MSKLIDERATSRRRGGIAALLLSQKNGQVIPINKFSNPVKMTTLATKIEMNALKTGVQQTILPPFSNTVINEKYISILQTYKLFIQAQSNLIQSWSAFPSATRKANLSLMGQNKPLASFIEPMASQSIFNKPAS